MKKLLSLITVFVLLTGCQESVMQKGVVRKVEAEKRYGYKYEVTVDNIQQAGIGGSSYILWTDHNYRVGDTIIIK